MSRHVIRSFAAIAAALGVLAAFWVYPALVFPHAATSNTVLFDREIVRILNEHCVMCHTEGGPSFSIATYEEAWLTRIASYDRILGRHMPPWAALPGYGEFANANSLTLRETRFFVSWVEGLGPRNSGIVFLNVLDPAAASRQEIRAHIDFNAWELGEPDRIISLPATVPAATATAAATAAAAATATATAARESPARVQRVVLDPGLSTDRRVRALEYRPGERGSIRAVEFKLEGSGQWLATWTPWHGFRRLPERMAYRIAAGSKIVAEIHTLEPGQVIADPGDLGLHFADGPAPAAPTDVVLTASGEIPAGTNAHRLHAETRLSADARILALWPTLPDGLESIEVSATLPNGAVEILLVALDVPLEWPTPYLFKTPVDLPAGSQLSLTAYTSNNTAVPAEQRVLLTMSLTYSEATASHTD